LFHRLHDFVRHDTARSISIARPAAILSVTHTAAILSVGRRAPDGRSHFLGHAAIGFPNHPLTHSLTLGSALRFPRRAPFSLLRLALGFRFPRRIGEGVIARRHRRV
jgi:hypothetical protein